MGEREEEDGRRTREEEDRRGRMGEGEEGVVDTNDLPLTRTQYCSAYLLPNFLGIEVGMCPVRRQRRQWEGYNESST